MRRSYSQEPRKSSPETLVPGVVSVADCTADTTQPSGPTEPVVSSSDAQEAKSSCPVHDQHLPERFKDYEL